MKKLKILNCKSQILFAVILSANLFAQDLSITASVSSRQISLNEQVTLTISARGDAARLPGLKLPPLNDFDIYSSGTSQNVSIINGKVSSVNEYNYILVPKRAGKLQIPSFQIVFKGKKYTTQSIMIEVLSSTAPGSQQSSRSKPRAESFWIKQTLNKKLCYVGEPVYYTFYFYADRGLARNPNLALPDFSGCLKDDLPPPKRYNTSVNGKTYSVTEIKSVIFPVKKGVFNFAPAKLEIVESSFPSGFGDDFFSGFFGRGRKKVLSTDGLTLKVKSLPEAGKPSGYSGAVGKFSITASADKKELKAGDAVNLTVRIEGEGNVNSITEPVFPNFSNFKQYDVISSQKIKKDNYRISGYKSFQTVLVPRLEGEQLIPSVKYSYFDPATGKYIQIETNPIRLKVKPGDKVTASSAAGPASLKEVSRDIRHIRQVKSLAGEGDFITGNFAVLQVIPGLFFLIVFSVKHRLHEKLLPAATLARKTAFSRAVAAVKKAPAESRLLCAELENILTIFLKERTGAGGMVSADKLLEEKNVPAYLVENTKGFIRRCQSERFSPLEDSFSGGDLKKDMIALLKELRKWT